MLLINVNFLKTINIPKSILYYLNIFISLINKVKLKKKKYN